MTSDLAIDQLSEILGGDDVEALRSALSNLMVLFETQNRNYLELRQYISTLPPPPRLSICKGDVVSIDGSESKPQTGGMAESAFEILASIRRSRRVLERTGIEMERDIREATIAQHNASENTIKSATFSMTDR